MTVRRHSISHAGGHVLIFDALNAGNKETYEAHVRADEVVAVCGKDGFATSVWVRGVSDPIVTTESRQELLKRLGWE